MRLELTRRGDYAVRAMLALAAATAADGPLSARRIASQMGIPARFVPHVLQDLVA
ncbi:MAG: transcriptional regulator, partial [Chloroflexi bacterium]|nr:transcriptional regulator [Chloroflexota bacterium]